MSSTKNSKKEGGLLLSDATTEKIKRIRLQRRRANPHRYYVPNGKAEQFIKKVGSDEYFVMLLSAANGIGKTAAGSNIVAHITFGESGNPFFEGLPIFKNFPYPKLGRIVSDPTTIQQTIVPELKKWMPPGRYTTSKSGKNYEYKWKTDTGHEFDLMTYEQQTSEFESKTLGWAWFDEPPPAAIFKATVARMRLGGIIFISATPLSGSSWMYDHIIAYKGKDKQRGFIRADVECACIEHGVRGHLKHKDIERMIAEYDEEDKQARVFGRFHHLIGLVFKKFSRNIHVIKPFDIERKHFVVAEALDPHPRNPDAVLWLAIDRKGRKIVIDELYARLLTKELAHRIKKKADQYRLIDRIADPLAFIQDQHEEDPEEKTLAFQLAELDVDYRPATKDRTRSDMRIKDALDFRVVGDEFLVSPELYVFETCERTIWELEHYRWAEWKGRTGEEKSPKEKPIDKDDHQIENLGRLLVQEYVFEPMPRASASAGQGGEPNLDPFE